MKNKIPCEVIRDLLPSYVDELTSEVTNQVIRDHLETCEDCRERYASMHAAEEIPQPDRQEKIPPVMKAKGTKPDTIPRTARIASTIAIATKKIRTDLY